MTSTRKSRPTRASSADSGPHGERPAHPQNRGKDKPRTLIDRDYGEIDLKDEALEPGDMIQGSDGNPVTGKP